MVTRPALTVPACSLHDCLPGSLPGQAPPRGPPCLGLLLREATSRCFHGSLLPLCRTRKKPRARRENPRSRRAGMRLDTRSPPRSGWDPGSGGAAVGISGTLTLLRSGPRVRAAAAGLCGVGGVFPWGGRLLPGHLLSAAFESCVPPALTPLLPEHCKRVRNKAEFCKKTASH